MANGAKGVLNSIHNIQVSRFVNLASSDVIMICNWCDVHLSTLNPYLLSYRTRCHSPYVEIVVVIVLEKSLCIMLARAIRLWLVS